MPVGWENLEREILWSSSTATADVPLSKALNPPNCNGRIEGCSHTGLHLNMNSYNCINKKQGGVEKPTCLLNKTLHEGEKYDDICMISLYILPCKSLLFSSHTSSVGRQCVSLSPASQW